jgi:hypothetical protein
MTEVMKWAFVGDLQIPYHDKRAVDLWLKVMKAWKPDVIDFVGDIDDQLEYSSFSDGTTDEAFKKLKDMEKDFDKEQAAYDRLLLKLASAPDEKAKELVREVLPPEPVKPDMSPLGIIKDNAFAAKAFYGDVRKQHKNAELHSSLGNHDIRIFKYMDKKAPEYAEQVTPNLLWGLDDLGISWRHYDLPPLERYAGIHVHHGATTTTTGLAVKNDIELYNISLVRGHDHRGGVVYKSYPMTGGSLAGMGTGHLCDPSAYGLKYTINPSWEKGFGVAYVVGGKAHLNFIPMRDYTVVLDGRVFKG